MTKWQKILSAGSCILFHLLFLSKWTSAKLTVQLDAMLDVGRCRGAGEELALSVCPVLLLLLSLSKESLESVRSHRFQATFGTNSGILLPAQNASFSSPFSTSCSPETKHLPCNQHVMQLQFNSSFPHRTRMRSLHFCDAVSQPYQLLGPGRPSTSLPQKDGKPKNSVFWWLNITLWYCINNFDT